jgi:hypothetical protein
MGLRDGQTVGLTLKAGGPLVPLPCQVVWMHKAGWRSWEIGLMFLDVPPAARESLNVIARGVMLQGELPSFDLAPR